MDPRSTRRWGREVGRHVAVSAVVRDPNVAAAARGVAAEARERGRCARIGEIRRLVRKEIEPLRVPDGHVGVKRVLEFDAKLGELASERERL